MFLVFAGSQALACSCALGLVFQFPADGDRVSVNTRLLAGFAGPADADIHLRRLDSQDDVEVTVEERVEDDYTWLVITPAAPLDPDTTYVADVLGDAFALGDVGNATFTTRSDVDAAAPLQVVLDARGRTLGGGSCGRWPALDLQFDGGADDQPGWYETEVASDASFADARSRTSLGEGAVLGDHTCGANLVDVPKPSFVRSRRVDATGEPGPWSDVARVGFSPLGCDHAPVGASWLAVALVLLRRRSGRYSVNETSTS